jgi:hypothetical protein
VNGIHIENNLAGNIQLEGCAISNCEVSNYGSYGIRVFASNGNSGFNSVYITFCSAHDNTGGLNGLTVSGITVHSDEGYQSGTPCFDTVTITGCASYNNIGTRGGGQWTGGGIIIGQANNAIITGCEVYNNGENSTNTNTFGGGPVGIGVGDSNNYRVSHCASHHNHTGNPWDGDGFNLQTNNGGFGLVEYCYSHDNDGFGFLFDSSLGFTRSTMRFCISENNSRKIDAAEVCLAPNNGIAFDCYNNTMFSSNKILTLGNARTWENWSGNVANNIFYTVNGGSFIHYSEDTTLGVPNIFFNGNLYFAEGAFSLD